MSSLYKQFKVDGNKQKEGVEVKFAPNDDESIPTFRLSYMSLTNQRYTKILERESLPFKRVMDLKRLSAEQDNMIMVRTFCESILLGWDNIQDIEGKPFPFNFENAVKLMLDLPELFLALKQEASDVSKFRADELELAAKN